MDGGAVAVVAVGVGVAGGKVDGAGNLFVKEGFLHGMEDVGIHADGEFTHVAGPLVGVQMLVDAVGVVGGGLHNPSVLEHKADVLGVCGAGEV